MVATAAAPPDAMIDSHRRRISYLRVSVTDRCDFRCVYCMAERPDFLPKRDLLGIDELERLCGLFIARGITKLRITGGEPLLRPGVMALISRLGGRLADGSLKELALSTNGSQLARFAAELAAAGVRRVNVSVDSLQPARFAAITRGGSLKAVLDGVEAARAAGLRIKINTVALRGINDDEFDELIAWCGVQGFDLCLIETMPLGEVGCDRSAAYLPLDAVRRQLSRRWTLKPSAFTSGGPARYVQVAETGGQLGFITPLTQHFCDGCNRLRLTCSGRLYACLGHEEWVDLKAPLRHGAAGAVDAAIDAALASKPRGHSFGLAAAAGRPAAPRFMSATGG